MISRRSTGALKRAGRVRRLCLRPRRTFLVISATPFERFSVTPASLRSSRRVSFWSTVSTTCATSLRK